MKNKLILKGLLKIVRGRMDDKRLKTASYLLLGRKNTTCFLD
jgi:hypothetical protein